MRALSHDTGRKAMLITIPVLAVPLTLITLIQTGAVQLPGFQAPSFDWFEKLVTPAPDQIDTTHVTYPATEVGPNILFMSPEDAQGVIDTIDDKARALDEALIKAPPGVILEEERKLHDLRNELMGLQAQSYNALYGKPFSDKLPLPTPEYVRDLIGRTDAEIARLNSRY